MLKWILEAGKVTGATVVRTTDEVPLSTAGTGALDSLLALLTGEDVDMPSGDTVSLKLLAELEDMPKPLIAKQQR